MIAAIPAAAEAPVEEGARIFGHGGGAAETPIWLRQSKPSTSAGAETQARARKADRGEEHGKANVLPTVQCAVGVAASSTIPTAPEQERHRREQAGPEVAHAEVLDDRRGTRRP